MTVRKDYKRLSYFAGISKQFQGFGFSICFDNPTWEVGKTINGEILFFYFRAWVVYKLKDKR